MKHQGLVGLPRNWRVITVASLTTFGLAYGAGQSAKGEWWSLSKAKPDRAKAVVEKAAPTENGFSSTIQRLMTDARLYADKGELDKAVQLAERAAKISEASSQLLGPVSDSSPEKTARLVSELLARRDAVAKRATPAAPTPTVVAAAMRATPAGPRPPEIASQSPPAQPRERQVVERALAERTVAEQPAELAAEPPAGKLAWAEELPPTPTPEAELASRPIKFRRSVLTRASQPADEDVGESQTSMTEPIVPSVADSAIDELLDVKFSGKPPVETESPVETAPLVPSTAVPRVGTSLNDPESAQAADRLVSLDGVIQPVAAEAPTDEAGSSPTEPAPQTGWEDEAFAEELLLVEDSASKPAGNSTKGAATATKETAPPFPEDVFPEQPEDFFPEEPEDLFPVQRVVQLRRRLETAASLNPGGAYTMPAGPVTEPTPAGGPVSSSDSEFDLPVDLPAPADDSMLPESTEETIDWNNLPNFHERPQTQTPSAAESAPLERPVVRLREHRVLPDHVRAALLKAAALPPAPTARRHIVGYSEPMLWQSADDHDAALPAMSLAKGIGGTAHGSHHANKAPLPPDLRELYASPSPSSETKRARQRLIPAVTVQQTGFRSIQLPSDSTPSTEPSGPTLASPDKGPDSPTLKGPASAPQSTDSPVESARSVKRPTAARPKPPTSKSKASHEVAHQSFALIEPLATALQLPIATTASLLGGVGLALLGLGLLLVRAAIRWRHR